MPPPLPHNTHENGSALTTTLRGVLFRCTIRGGHATLAIVPSSSENGSNKSDDKDSSGVVIIVVQFGGNQWGGCDLKTSENGRSSDDFANSISQMRSNIRRMCKLGNELEFIGNFAHDASPDTKETSDNNNNNRRDWNAYQRRKFIVDYGLESCQDNIKVTQVGKWDATKCQMLRSKFFDGKMTKQQQQKKKQRRNDNNIHDRSDDNKQEHHYQAHAAAKGKTKRIQGEVLADFVLWMLSTIHNDDVTTNDDIMKQSTAAAAAAAAAAESAKKTTKEEQIYEEIGLKKTLLPTDHNYLFIERWRALHLSLSSTSQSLSDVQARNERMAEKLRKRSTDIISSSGSNSSDNSKQDVVDCQQHHLGGILDAAGGAGHVSLALSLRRIHSTIVDPRPTIGKLPGRDRKVLKKSKSKVPFSTYRAWFGSKPEGVDTVYREGRLSLETFLPESELSSSNNGQHQLPICSMTSTDRLLPNCAAIVALHPDEATGVIVQTAVENKIPFCVVPCCVFSRLFPERINPRGNGGVVSTYYELIDWLVALHPEIRVTTLPFEGANIAVWATFQ